MCLNDLYYVIRRFNCLKAKTISPFRVIRVYSEMTLMACKWMESWLKCAMRKCFRNQMFRRIPQNQMVYSFWIQPIEAVYCIFGGSSWFLFCYFLGESVSKRPLGFAARNHVWSLEFVFLELNWRCDMNSSRESENHFPMTNVLNTLTMLLFCHFNALVARARIYTTAYASLT